jgi:hypothetical protein
MTSTLITWRISSRRSWQNTTFVGKVFAQEVVVLLGWKPSLRGGSKAAAADAGGETPSQHFHGTRQ